MKTQTQNQSSAKTSTVSAISEKEMQLAKINAKREAFALYVAQRDQAQQALTAEAEANRKVRSTGVKYLGKEDFLRLAIYKAGSEGIKLHKLVAVAKTYVDRNGDVKPISTITVKHNWGNKALLQRGQYKLTQEDLPMEERTTDCMIAYEVTQVADSVNKGKTENKISVLDFSREELKDYLVSQGATEEMFTA